MTISTLRIASTSSQLASDLTEAICTFFSEGNNEGEREANNTNISGSNTNNILQISNRYFDAFVALEPLLVDNNTTTDTTGANPEDGIVLVFDNASKSDFDRLAQLHTVAESSGQNGDLLRLCLGIANFDAHSPLPGTKEHEDEYARRILWCLDRGYEYVEGVNISPQGIQQGHEEREKEGFARVIEAIQGTVWTSAKMHAKKQQQLKQSYQETQQALDANEQEEENQYEPPPTTLPMPTTISEEESKEREEKAREALLKQDNINISDTKSEDENAHEYIDGKVPEHDKEHKQTEQFFSEMEGALKEANRIREMSRNGELSDEDRRQRAGDAATLLMNMMQQMGGMDSDGDDSEENGGDRVGSDNED